MPNLNFAGAFDTDGSVTSNGLGLSIVHCLDEELHLYWVRATSF